MPDLVPIKRALVSVSDKAGLVPFCRELAEHGVEIISTGGTAAALRQAGLAVTPIDDVTGFPEILGGRVKTLHPGVHGGLLGVRDDPSHAEQMARHGIKPIDLVCVNLYPFERTVARAGCTEHEAIENIDIGGPSMIRSGAKNFEHVAVCTSPSQYERVRLDMAGHGGATRRALRAQLAREAFAATSRYDGAIASYLCGAGSSPFPALLNLSYIRGEELRYGENPHQAAAIYRPLARAGDAPGPSIATAEQLHGKELSYNNINDAAASLDLVLALGRAAPGLVPACVIKHTNPCGAAAAPGVAAAIERAVEGDPVAAYGGILAVGDEFTPQAAAWIVEKKLFLEVIVAPSYSTGAIDLLRAKWANLRLLAVSGLDTPPAHPMEMRSIPGGLLVQDRDARLARGDEFMHRAGPAPTPDVLRIAAFLEPVARSLFSNSVALGGVAPGGAVRLFGAGAGQMDRVTACGLAVGKAGDLASGAVAFSDAFFPFADGPRLLLDAGVKTIVHPGGSKRDRETFDLCEERGVTCLTTGLRHFRH